VKSKTAFRNEYKLVSTWYAMFILRKKRDAVSKTACYNLNIRRQTKPRLEEILNYLQVLFSTQKTTNYLIFSLSICTFSSHMRNHSPIFRYAVNVRKSIKILNVGNVAILSAEATWCRSSEAALQCYSYTDGRWKWSVM
jgi:hypothetical protein